MFPEDRKFQKRIQNAHRELRGAIEGGHRDVTKWSEQYAWLLEDYRALLQGSPSVDGTPRSENVKLTVDDLKSVIGELEDAGYKSYEDEEYSGVKMSEPGENLDEIKKDIQNDERGEFDQHSFGKFVVGKTVAQLQEMVEENEQIGRKGEEPINPDIPGPNPVRTEVLIEYYDELPEKEAKQLRESQEVSESPEPEREPHTPR